METIIELNENNEIDPTFFIEVGIIFDGNFIRQRLELKECDLNVDLVGLDIKQIMHNLKLKQIELLNKEKKDGEKY